MPSERHHYIPQFYIKGFVNSNNMVFVYDKIEKGFKHQEFSPKQIFYEWNRNTLIIDENKDDFIEKLYGRFENLVSPTYDKIKKQTGRINYEVNDIFNLLILVSLTHWRLPLNDSNAEQVVASLSKSEMFWQIFNKQTGEEATSDFYEEIKKRKGFVEIYKVSKPISDFTSLDIANCVNNWVIYSTNTDTQFHLLGDNPIIFKNEPLSNILENEMIFPLTKGITLYHNKRKKIVQIRAEDRLKVDIMVFLQSQRYVVCPNRNYLNMIHLLAQNYNTEKRLALLKSEIFDIFKEHGD